MSVHKRGWYPNITRRSNYRKVRFALCMLTDESGYYTEATNAEIGRLAGFGAKTVGEYLAEFEWDGSIVTFFNDRGRVIILTDTPAAQDFIVWAMKTGRLGSPGSGNFEGSGPLATGEWPKPRQFRDLTCLIPTTPFPAAQ
jgi:hypothetical protein